MRHLLTLALLVLPIAPAQADQTAPSDARAALTARVTNILAQAPAGTRYGLMVTEMDGTELLAVAPDQRFIPASNTKIYTTVAGYAHLAALEQAGRGTGVRLEPGAGGALDVVLAGRGDARLSSAADCKEDCLATLADAVAAKTRRVRNIIGDDSWYPDQRWSPGMSWNNIPTRSGTGISALTLDDNEIVAWATPAAIGQPPKIASDGYYAIENRAVTVAGSAVHLDHWRDPQSFELRVTGTIGIEAKPERLRFGIDDPAHYAAWRLRALLAERGVRVTGALGVRHRPLAPADDPEKRGAAPAAMPPEPEMLASLPMLPLAPDVAIINKVSQNLHAELMLRRLGRLGGSGSIADGQAALGAVMAQAGLPRAGYDLSDGSGMSSYNRISPRATATLLRWVAGQPWGAAWRETLPVGGQDGTLRRRFAGTPLDGKLFAKTGSLNATSALSGYMETKSGHTLIFSAIANDVPDGETERAIAAMDAALGAIADAL